MAFSYLVYVLRTFTAFYHYSPVHLRRRRRLPLRPGGGRQQRREQALLLRVRLQPVQDLLPGAAATAAAAGVSSGGASAALLNSRGACLSEGCVPVMLGLKLQSAKKQMKRGFPNMRNNRMLQEFLSVVAALDEIIILRCCIIFSLLPSV